MKKKVLDFVFARGCGWANDYPVEELLTMSVHLRAVDSTALSLRFDESMTK